MSSTFIKIDDVSVKELDPNDIIIEYNMFEKLSLPNPNLNPNPNNPNTNPNPVRNRSLRDRMLTP